MTKVAARVACAPVRLYQVVTAARPPSCRYWPSCSQYAIEAIERHGVARGAWLAARRLGRCHPWTPGGVDHVPDRQRPDLGQGRPERPRAGRRPERPRAGRQPERPRAGSRPERPRAGRQRS